MFTGIIEEVGIVRSVVRRDAGAVLTIDCHIVLEDIFEGASIAVNGVCLTVTSFTANSFCAEAVHETLRRSSPRRARNARRCSLSTISRGI